MNCYPKSKKREKKNKKINNIITIKKFPKKQTLNNDAFV